MFTRAFPHCKGHHGLLQNCPSSQPSTATRYISIQQYPEPCNFVLYLKSFEGLKKASSVSLISCKVVVNCNLALHLMSIFYSSFKREQNRATPKDLSLPQIFSFQWQLVKSFFKSVKIVSGKFASFKIVSVKFLTIKKIVSIWEAHSLIPLKNILYTILIFSNNDNA